MPLSELSERRLIIVTGKGGVGKTAVTVSLARAFAAKGRRVLCAEIVPLAETPSQLSAALGGPPPTEEPIEVRPGVWAALLTPGAGHLRFLQDTLPIRILADAAMRSMALRRFLSAAPGFSDMGVMYRMLDLMKRTGPSGTPFFDVCLIDSPATGHALALAQIPEFLTRAIPAGPIFRAAQEGVSVLTNPVTTGAVIVTLPETLPVTEALELQRGLARYKLPVSAIAVNRVPANPFSAEERAAMTKVLSPSSPPVFGHRELRRIDRADAAIELLKQQATTPFVTLPEVPGEPTEALGALV
ncbi:MAG: ArsA family ATPase [Archangium sp.]|nr:ArsA family ATPase [Archangium sp.]